MRACVRTRVSVCERACERACESASVRACGRAGVGGGGLGAFELTNGYRIIEVRNLHERRARGAVEPSGAFLTLKTGAGTTINTTTI